MHSETITGASRILTALLLAGTLAACGDARTGGGEAAARAAHAGEDTASAQSSLIGSESVKGLAALHDTVYARAARGDTLGLLRLFVRDSVYRAVVWPTQPSYEPGRDEVWLLVGGMNKANSNKGLRRLLSDIEDGGKPDVPAFTRKVIAGGVIHSREKKALARGELSLFAAALCRAEACQVLTYANAGLVGKKREGDIEDEAPGEEVSPAP